MDRVMRAADVRLPEHADRSRFVAVTGTFKAGETYTVSVDASSLSAEIAALPGFYQRDWERRHADRRRQDAVLFAGERRVSGERRAK